MPGGKNQITGKDGKLFKAGDSRINLLGRPRKMNLEKLLRKVLMERIGNQAAIKGILIKLRDQALAGDIRAAELLLDRAFGRAKQTLEPTGPFAIIGIQYIVPNNGDSNKADPEATRSVGSAEEVH
jgi:hypothetical protein